MTDQPSAVSSSPPGEIEAQLGRVEAELRASVTTNDPLLTEMASHLITAGGKRQRPFVGLAAAACAASYEGGDLAPEVFQGGVSVELVHLGSLYHDDVIDEAEIRRQADSVNARWGNLRAILAGDFLLARASEIAASLSTEIAGLLAATIAELCEGEVSELRTAYNVARTEDEYFSSIGGKTASLFKAAARIGALTSGQPRKAVDALGQFGWCYGIAFQIVDDILDLTASEAQMGKPVGHDMAEGVYTLPVLRVLADNSGEPADRAGNGASELASLLGREVTEAEVSQARQLVLAGGGITSATATAIEWLDRADSELANLPGAAGINALAGLTARLRASLGR